MAKIQNTDNPKCWGVCGAMGACSFPVGMQNGTANSGKQFGSFYKTNLSI